ncbi:MAG: LCP family protein [Capsulimonadaceae bacterium]|nr:LCP family protein [Capsulimonadaceae bacterium]
MGVPPRQPVRPVADTRSAQRSAPRKPVKRPRSGIPRIVAVIAAIGVFCVAAFASYLVAKTPILRALMHNPTVANQFPGVRTMNIMIVGRDYDYNNQDQVIKTHARSDMLMVGRLDFENNTVRLLSIPRDTHAHIPGHGVHKINTAHAIGGPKLAAETITSNFGIPVDHYIAIDFQGFEKAIDLMHGVDVTVDRKMDYDDNWGHLHIHLLPGYQHLAGSDAIGFVRFRHADTDIIRTHRQQALVAAIKLKMVEPSTLVVLPSILNTVDKHVVSDLTTDQKIALAKFVRSAPRERVEMQTMPNQEGPYYVYTNWQDAAPLIQSWFGVEPPARLERHCRHGGALATRIASARTGRGAVTP